LPAARTAIASRIMAELQSVRRLCPASLVDELKTCAASPTSWCWARANI
jgi:hypothetical protein